MGRILIIAIVINLIISLTVGIAASIVEKTSLYFIYVGMLLFGSMFFPLLIATGLYFLIKHRLKKNYDWKGVVIYSFILLIVIQLGLIIWSMLAIIRYNLGFSRFTIQNIIDDYKKEFSGFFLITIFYCNLCKIFMWRILHLSVTISLNIIAPNSIIMRRLQTHSIQVN